MSNKDSNLTIEQANLVYDVLVEMGGASESMRDAFVHYNTNDYDYECGHKEWRFGGKFGIGGKYRRHNGAIDYYFEDTTMERDELQKKINNRLTELHESFRRTK